MEQCMLMITSFACGMLGSTPFIWCLLFRSMFSQCESYENIIYFWATLVTQLLMGIYCFKRYSKLLSKSLDLICVLNITLLIACLLCVKFHESSYISVPILFSLNLLLLSVWLPVTYEAVHLCPEYSHACFQMGFYTSVMSYYCMIVSGNCTSFLFVPVASFLPLGLYALRMHKKQQEFKDALFDKKSIFISKKEMYVRLRMETVPSLIGAELFLVLALTIVFIIFLVTVSIYTNVIIALKTYILIFHFGTFCSGGFGYSAHWATYAYVMVGSVFASLVFVLESLQLKSLLFFGVFFCFMNAINGEFGLMHKKLKRGINGCKIVLSVCLLVNLFISVTLNVIDNIY
nr:homolog of EHV2 ORF58 envelope protein UL43 [Macronycteris gammaherpesvirus 1]